MCMGGVCLCVQMRFPHCSFRLCVASISMAYVRDISLRAEMPKNVKRKLTVVKFGDVHIPEGYATQCSIDCLVGLKLLYSGDRQKIITYCCEHDYSEYANTLLRNRFVVAHREGHLYPKETRKFFHCTEFHEVWYKIDELLPCNGCALSFLNLIDLNDHVEFYHMRGAM